MAHFIMALINSGALYHGAFILGAFIPGALIEYDPLYWFNYYKKVESGLKYD